MNEALARSSDIMQLVQFAGFPKHLSSMAEAITRLS